MYNKPSHYQGKSVFMVFITYKHHSVFLALHYIYKYIHKMSWVKESAEAGLDGLMPQEAKKHALPHPDFQNMPDALFQSKYIIHYIEMYSMVQ